jgi:hypothetical protein
MNHFQIERPVTKIIPRHWLELRREIFCDSDNGAGRCYDWVKLAYAKRQTLSCFDLEIMWKRNIWFNGSGVAGHHFWLQGGLRDNLRDIFVADGTAGQFTAEYPLGFYGTFNDNSELFRQIYIQGNPFSNEELLISGQHSKGILKSE